MTTVRNEKQQQWRQHIEAYLLSGLSKRAYCKENDLNYQSFHYHWKQCHKKPVKVKASTAKRFATIKLSSEQKSSDLLDIKFPNGLHCQCPIDIDSARLKQLIDVMSQ